MAGQLLQTCKEYSIEQPVSSNHPYILVPFTPGPGDHMNSPVPSILPSQYEKVLVFLNIAKEIRGKTKFQKLFFLGDEEYALESGFEFVRYNYGPYSFQLTEAIEALTALELIRVEEEQFDSEGPFQGRKLIYSLTSKGDFLSHSLAGKYPTFISAAQKVVEDWNNKPLRKIIPYVYQKYM